MTIQLPENLENSLREVVHNGQFASVNDAMAEATRLLLHQLKHGLQGPAMPSPRKETSRPAPKPIWEDILELTAKVPDEEFDKLPPDGAEQHDHYIYGIRKT